MTPHERSSLPRVASLLFTLVVAGLAVVVLYEVATAVGFSPLDSGPKATPRSIAAAAVASPTARAVGVSGSAAPLGSASPGASSAPSGSPRSVAQASPSPTGETLGASSSASAEPSSSASPASSLNPPPTDGPFSIDLYERGDFVSEMNKVACVPAAMQTMINIMSPGADTTVATQQKLYTLTRRLSPNTLKGSGAEPEGWAEGLNQMGLGPYMVDVQPTRTAMIKAAARALRLTGRPVGILAWRGAHSWVMSGFKSSADPALTDAFTVSAVYIQDVWYPRISSIWGPSRPPDTLVRVGLLGEDILPWRRPTGAYIGKDGNYVLVLPVAG
jgi:hypothetical protein